MSSVDQGVHALILGAAGYGGGELLRLLDGHPAVGRVQAVSRSHQGQPWHAAHPRFRGFIQGRFEGRADWSALARSARPVLFSAQPNGRLAEQWPELERAFRAHGLTQRITVIDLSGDFRLPDADSYQRAYGAAHACPASLPGWVYGLSEHHADRLAHARRIANPGCFATAIQLGLRPLLEMERPDWVAINGVTGSSGSGVHASPNTHHPERAGDFRAYRMLTHQHAAEVRQGLADVGGEDCELAFVPHSAPLVRGIFITLQARVSASTARGIRDHYARALADQPFVRPVESSPRIHHVVGSNACDVGVAVSGQQVAVMVALDNLIKGMAGQALQNMNLSLGLDQTLGLGAPA
ncbi:N-acetyl-gamma-glutamyl-phosphate reductase [Natronospira bacteriovora]|uniref:N-acetyl-gamma-glutamyl-phosphate reductase n=1 Tax=Natronospira bacteriovora TaxID=3069753 RepID=A0ABU0W9C4_9GAMM|nr:N-acetyl-gamma-glutamyl-phosphate reductase [Natronospira sp. AB-CW4]MDQ2069585.1 N-acetyl-gamma-glutamyl-phosphate reductase [Natronospira sp. AB-CW4]